MSSGYAIARQRFWSLFSFYFYADWTKLLIYRLLVRTTFCRDPSIIKLPVDLKMMDEALRLKRRTADDKLNRQGRATRILMKQKRPSSEVRESLEVYERMYQELIDTHDAFAATVRSDVQIGLCENPWIRSRQEDFLKLRKTARNYLTRNPDSSNP